MADACLITPPAARVEPPLVSAPYFEPTHFRFDQDVARWAGRHYPTLQLARAAVSKSYSELQPAVAADQAAFGELLDAVNATSRHLAGLQEMLAMAAERLAALLAEGTVLVH